MLIDEIRNIKGDSAKLRMFALTLGLFLALAGVFILWRAKGSYPIREMNAGTLIRYAISSGAFYFIAASFITVFAGRMFPAFLKPIYKTWMSLALIIGHIVTAAILTVLFYSVVFPIGIIARLLGNDFLDRGISKDKKTYWIPKERTVRDKAEYERQF